MVIKGYNIKESYHKRVLLYFDSGDGYAEIHY